MGSCETQLLTLAEELISGFDKKQQHDIIILDFSKAFDRIPHQRLLKTLEHWNTMAFNALPTALSWITAFLTDQTQQVLVEDSTSVSIHVISRVPQGTILGHLLFLIFINNLPDCVQSSSRLFADDYILYRRIKNQENCQILQDDRKRLPEQERKWGIYFNLPRNLKLAQANHCELYVYAPAICIPRPRGAGE